MSHVYRKATVEVTLLFDCEDCHQPFEHRKQCDVSNEGHVDVGYCPEDVLCPHCERANRRKGQRPRMRKKS